MSGSRLIGGEVFRQAGKLKKAMVAHEKALDWQGLFELAVQANTPEAELKDMGFSMAGMRTFCSMPASLVCSL